MRKPTADQMVTLLRDLERELTLTAARTAATNITAIVILEIALNHRVKPHETVRTNLRALRIHGRATAWEFFKLFRPTKEIRTFDAFVHARAVAAKASKNPTSI